uniref:Uncharacterized protein n=1 Tax=Rhizophora mucronata TaxID=61149 RepID=A0A2P2QZ10_RHIMU
MHVYERLYFLILGIINSTQHSLIWFFDASPVSMFPCNPLSTLLG